MMRPPDPAPLIAIACGGTGGHVFPGLALSEALRDLGAQCQLFVSMKHVDRQALDATAGVRDPVDALPATGWDWRRPWAFVTGFCRAWQKVRSRFSARLPTAVVTMGGFTGAAPVLVGMRLGVPVFLHESNAVPGRANRWLAPYARAAFVGFPQAAARLRLREVRACGTPVRSAIRPGIPAICRGSLGLAPGRSTLLVVGGSQGARAIDRLVAGALESWRTWNLDLQFVHLTGREGESELRAAYARYGFRARVTSFLREMELALGAADLAVSRAGASTLAELAAVRLPAMLIPFPSAVDNHQVHNARAYAESGAACWSEQAATTPGGLAEAVAELLRQPERRARMASALGRWHRPDAAVEMAQAILRWATPDGRVAATGSTGRADRRARSSVGGEDQDPRVLEPSSLHQ